MFFFIAGIQPKAVYLDEEPAKCPSCGLFEARIKRIDHYISIFFIPLLRVKKGAAFIECKSCGSLGVESEEKSSGPWVSSRTTCPYCGKMLKQTFRFCPYCGKSV